MRRLPSSPVMRAFLTLCCLVSACWSTDGPGPGPYTQCGQPSDCALRGETYCLQRKVSDPGIVDLEPLFCSRECEGNDPSSCPLAKRDDGLEPACIEIVDDADPVCVLTSESPCPIDMLEFSIAGYTVCVFPQ